ncbi:hypothetical protein [Sphingomonas sanguinis]|uniref:hypothetical protein n=1 Tax=Sphingomonas sanguinis TaxID=33051 RepID=UPI00301ABD16
MAPVRLPSAHPAAFGAAVGAGIEQVGDALHRAEQARRDARANDEQVRVSVALEQLKADTEAFEAGMKDGTNPASVPGGFGLHDVTQQFWKERADQLLGGVTDKRVRDTLSVRLAGYAGDLAQRTRVAEAVANGRYFKQGAEDYSNALTNRVSRIQGRVERGQAMADGLHDIDEYIGGLSIADETLRDQLRREMTDQFKGSIAMSWADDDPNGVRELVDSPLYEGVDPQVNERIRARVTVAENRIRVGEERKQREQQAADREAEGAYLGDIGRGVAVDPQVGAAMAARAEARGDTNRARELRAAAVGAQVNTVYGNGNADPGQMTTRISQIESTKDWRKNPDLVAEHAQLDRLRGQMRNAEFELPMLDFNNSAAVNAQIKQMNVNALTHNGKKQIINRDQAQQMANRAQSGPAGRMEVAESLSHLTGEAAMVGLEQVAPKDYVMRAAIDLPSRLRAEVFRGEELMKGNTTLVNNRDVNIHWGERAGRAMEGLPGEWQLAMKTAATALYASRSKSGEDFDERLYDQCLQEVVSPRGGGGIGSHRGVPILLPDGMNQRELDQRWANLPEMPIYDKDGRIGSSALRSRYRLRQTGQDGGYYLVDQAGRFALNKSGGRFLLDIRRVPLAQPAPPARGGAPVTVPKGPVYIAPPVKPSSGPRSPYEVMR